MAMALGGLIHISFGKRRSIMSSAIERMLAVIATASVALAVGPRAWGQGAGQQGSAPAPGKWGRLAPLPEKSEEFTFTDVNGKIYLFGGLPEGNKGPLGLVQEYDAATDKWTMKKKMPLATHHAAAAVYNGKIYLFGGQAQLQPGGPSQIPIDNAWEYDPATDTWKALAPMPTARTAAVAAAVGGKIYVIGGASVHPGQKVVSLGPTVPHRSLGTNEVYDPATNKWETRTEAPTARNHAAVGVVNGKIYIIGGRVGSAVTTTGSNTNVVEVYDPATDNWGVAGLRMPTPRSGMGWATHNGKIYVAGGEMYNRDFFAVIRAVEVYDPATNTWGRLPPMPTARHGVNVAAIGNRLYVIGGHIQGAGTGGEVANSDVNEVYTFPN
jgi:N-acetylneuraminic acid mutarotase